MTEKRRLAAMSGFVGALICALLFMMFKCVPSEVQAQGPIGNVNFAQPFSVTMSASQTFFSVNNIGQAAGSVQFHGTRPANCPVLLEGSADNSHWSTLAASAPGSAGSTFMYANGFFSYYRLAFNPYANGGCNNQTIAGSYYGYSAPLPVTPRDAWVTVSNISAPATLPQTGDGPVALDGVECTNTGAATAYLQLFDGSNTLGSNFFFQIGIGAGATFASGVLPSYVTSLTGSDTFYAGASTTAGGSTAGGPLVCDFQLNVTGPFYPLLPVAP
jgi:hypothetical protein